MYRSTQDTIRVDANDITVLIGFEGNLLKPSQSAMGLFAVSNSTYEQVNHMRAEAWFVFVARVIDE